MVNHFTTKPLILVDGSSYLYRAFHAMPSLSNSKGFPTGAIYGVINMLRRLIIDYQPEHIAVVFDSKEKTFRETLYEHYKANRSAMPDDLIPQVKPVQDIIQALGIPLLVEPGVEADDVIGTLVKHAERHGMPVIISTGDKDFAQLVNPQVTLVNTMTDSVLNPETVTEKFGVLPEQIIDYLALVGDSVDNIPGVPGVGPKTAAKWLNEYGSLDNIIAHADQIKGKVGENLRASLEQLPLAKTLATIKTDMALHLSFADLVMKTPDTEKLKTLYGEFEFKTWLNALLEKNPKENTEKYADYETVFTEERLHHWIDQLKKADLFAFDTETTSLNTLDAEIVGLSFAVTPGKSVYIPLAHSYENAPLQLNREETLKQLKPLLENASLLKIGHNIKYDLNVLANYGIRLNGIAFDTMLESWIKDSSANNHNMDTLALKYLGWRTIHYEDVAGKGAKQVTFDKVHIEPAATYAAEDADVTLQLHHTFWPLYLKEPALKKVFEQIEMPLIPVLARMERNGVLIDAKKLEKQSEELEKRLTELEHDTFKIAGQTFNLNSPKQLQDVLYTQLQLPVLQKTPGGQPSTAEAVLQELAADYPLPKLIIEYRGLSKLISTYTRRLPEDIHPRTHRIHTSYNQTGTATGRLSSSNPNLQNIPVRTHEGRRIRQAFIAAKDHQLISADYSQIELRIMAHISNDPGLLSAFEKNLDVHKATAAEVFGLPLEAVTSVERRAAKAINFGLIYGMSAFGLAKQLGIDRQAAEDYIVRYFARYPGVKDYMEETRAMAHKQGYVETLWGRRLYLPDINSSQIMRQKAAERTAINAPLQGSAADIIKRAMISLHHWLEQHQQTSAKMIMQVHDELVFEVANNDVANMCEVIRSHMMQAASLKVPLLVDVGAGNNWDEASA
ncbi:MAG TPA: DNA polymerase I [Gammaproteobacteria bacterium]|nr:DNA polymerase I [Gammaproteobacteria bacterium]